MTLPPYSRHQRVCTARVDLTSAPPPPFVDVTREAGVTYRYDSGSSDRMFIADTMGGGVGLFDYDNDGWLDIYFVNGCAIPLRDNALPVLIGCTAIRAMATFRDVTARLASEGEAMEWAVRSAITTTMGMTTCW